MKGKKTRIMACPACGKMVSYEGNPYRPFCSRGCKGIDLVRWSDEAYRIAREDHGEDNGGEDHGE